MYSNLGLGFASGCIVIIAEIIYARLTRQGRNLQCRCGTSLFLLTLSAILTAVTVLMIQAYHYPLYYLIQKIQYYNPKVDYQFATGRYERFQSHSSSLCEWGSNQKRFGPQAKLAAYLQWENILILNQTISTFQMQFLSQVGPLPRCITHHLGPPACCQP